MIYYEGKQKSARTLRPSERPHHTTESRAAFGKLPITIIPRKARHARPLYGEYSEYYEGYKWQKLTTAAAHYGYNWSEHGSAHDSRADCYATLYVHEKIMQSIYGDENAPPVDVVLTPSPGGRDCLGNGEHDGIEIQCDECAHYLECSDDQKEQKP